MDQGTACCQTKKQTNQVEYYKKLRTNEQLKETNTQVEDLRTDCYPKENIMNSVQTYVETNELIKKTRNQFNKNCHK